MFSIKIHKKIILEISEGELQKLNMVLPKCWNRFILSALRGALTLTNRPNWYMLVITFHTREVFNGRSDTWKFA